MNTFTLLTLLSVIAASALFIALGLFLFAITNVLEAIGGEAKGYGTIGPERLSSRCVRPLGGHDQMSTATPELKPYHQLVV